MKFNRNSINNTIKTFSNGQEENQYYNAMNNNLKESNLTYKMKYDLNKKSNKIEGKILK